MKSIRSRLIAGLGLIIVFFLLQAALVWWGQASAKRDVVDVTRKNTIATSQLGELGVLAQQIRRYEKEYFVYVGNTERRAAYTKEWSDTADKIAKRLQTMRSNTDQAFDAADVAKVGNWISASDFYGAEMRKIFGTVTDQAAKVASAAAAPAAPAPAPAPVAKGSAPVAAPTEAAVAMLSPVEVNGMITAGKDRFSGVLIKGVAEMSAEKTKQTLALSEVAEKGFNQLLAAVLATVAVGVLAAMALMFTLPKAVIGPLATLTASVDGMSKGNLDAKVDVGGVVEFEGLSKALERMRLSQQAMVARMRR
jgi:nitrogen fixation/metabolism regulation signal transduction histidine kinase